MAAFYPYTPNYSGVALINTEILLELISASPVTNVRDMLLEVYFGHQVAAQVFGGGPGDFFSSYYSYSDRPPCLMLTAQDADCVYIALSGCQRPRGLQDAVNEYLEGRPSGSFQDPTNNPMNRPSFDSWAADYWAVAAGRISPGGKHIRIVGHSLGGAIATSMATIASQISGVQSVHLCTIGTPKAWNRPSNYYTSIEYARWVNPLDNVPRLPPAPAQAPQIWDLLTRTQQLRVLSWRHPNEAFEVAANGSITKVGDQPSLVLTLNTVLQAMNSPQGVTGRGHSLETYRDYLRAAHGAIAGVIPAYTTIAPQTVGPTPATLPPMRNVPATLPPLPPPADTTARRVVYAAAASDRNVSAPTIPKPAKMRAVKLDGYYAIEWMGYIIAYGPTKKKARACARHFNAFLHPFIGVASCDSQSFVFALADWLRNAADPLSGFVPTLQDNGTGVNIGS